MSIILFVIKFILFATLCIALVAHFFITIDNPQLEALGAGDFFIYSREVVASPLVISTTHVGFGIIYKTRAENAMELRRKFDVIDGESITLDRAKSTRDVLRLLGHEVVDEHSGGGKVVTYAFSGRGREFIVSDGRRINLQVVERGGRTSVGWPVILGSF